MAYTVSNNQIILDDYPNNPIDLTVSVDAQDHSGCPVIIVDATASNTSTACANLVTVEFHHTTNQDEITSYGNIDGVKKQCILLVLGEPTTLLSEDDHLQARQNISIRSRLQTMSYVGQTCDLSSILSGNT